MMQIICAIAIRISFERLLQTSLRQLGYSLPVGRYTADLVAGPVLRQHASYDKPINIVYIPFATVIVLSAAVALQFPSLWRCPCKALHYG